MSGARTLSKAVVVEYISNPARFKRENTDGLFEQLQDANDDLSVSNPKYVTRVPRGSVLAIVVSEGKSQTQPKPQVFYPFFSHISMPLKVGEKVWVMFETAGKETSLGYWLSRCVSDGQIDDPNYTHDDRNSLAVDGSDQGTSAAFESAATGDAQVNTLSFPDGAAGQGSTTLPSSMTYETLLESSVSDYETTQEAVPRYSAMSSELALEGSNNTRIVLGEYRYFGVPNDPTVTGVGAIDIVAGTGQEGTETAPAAVAENDRGLEEVDKNPTVSGNADEDNEDEAEPSFEYDLSRVLLSMNSSSDDDFGLEFPDNVEGSVDNVEEDAYVIIKSNQNRIISREDGSIRIIKEGTEDSNRAIITIEADGTIMIDGPKIVIGSGYENSSGANGEGTQIIIGRDATEPIVLGQTLVDILTTFSSDLSSGYTTSLGNMGGPFVDMGVAAACSALESALDTILSKVGKTQ